MKKSKTDVDQLTLNLTFSNPGPLIRRIAQALLEIADEQPASKKVDSDTPTQATTRAALRKQVGILMLTRGWTYHQAYVLVYDAFHTRTGIHPAVESAKQGLKTHLDVIFQNPAWPKILMEVIDGLLTQDVGCTAH